MRAVSFLIAGLTAGAGFGATACGNGDDASSPPIAIAVAEAGADASKRPDATAAADAAADAGTAIPPDAGDAAGEAAMPTLALLRMGNWSADSPAVQFCLAPHGTGSFRGPIPSETAAALGEGGVATGLPFPATTSYQLMDPGAYDTRIVVAGSVDCSAGIIPDVPNLPVLNAASFITIALVGAAHPVHAEPGLEIVAFTDELQNSLSGGATLIRVINAAADLPLVDVGTLDSTNTYLTPFFTSAIPFGASSVVNSMADPNGYGVNLPFMYETIAARVVKVASLLGVPAQTIVAQAPNISLSVGVAVTFVVVGSSSGQVAADSGAVISQILECVENAATNGLVAGCQVISQ